MATQAQQQQAEHRPRHPVICVSLNSCVDRTLETDFIQIGHICQAKIIGEHPAGKGVNVAHVLGQLGVPVRLYGFVGQDRLSLFRNHLLTYVDCRLRALPGRTRVNTTIIDKTAHTETHIREQGTEVTQADLQALMQEILSEAHRGQWIIFSGSLPPGLSPDVMGELVRSCKQRSMRVAVDASGDSLKQAVEESPDLIKPNREELCYLLGKDLVETIGIAETASRLPYYHPDMRVLASDGANGCYYITKQGRVHAKLDPATPVSVMSTIGCGDALLAGFLCGVHEGWDVTQCLRYAVRVATASLPCYRAAELDMTILYMDPLNVHLNQQ
eukprot:gnl/Trimastix_PCT/3234.p1 GENE.gnl/Trimastix_PCT/3234~~gnl/Trimastix_PCT/3234.p1  ORF type:complete len:329 (+),score=81.46 gnl/Trimastix_PCT/3234:51-1037(+)